MFSDDKSIVTVFNGEIYNFTITKDLNLSATNLKGSILKLLAAIKNSVNIVLAEGMFAIAIYDLKRKN